MFLKYCAFQVLLGSQDNTKSAIFKNTIANQTVVEADTDQILNCDQYIDFWIRWEVTGLIQVEYIGLFQALNIN